MHWLIIVSIAYLLNAIAVTIDKFLLLKKIPNPAVYTFFIGSLGLAVFVLAPLEFNWPGYSQLIVALISGLFFTAGIFYMFKAIGLNEVSRISPFIGGLQPIIILIFAWFLLNERLSPGNLMAFFIILAGTFLISRQNTSIEAGGQNAKKAYLLALISSIFFAASYTLSKDVFNHQGFISGLIWTRIGAFLGAMMLLLKTQNRRDIIKQIKPAKSQATKRKWAGTLFMTGQSCGALSAILVYYAISISASVAIINATRGLEYVFLLIIVIILSKRHPRLLEEKLEIKTLIQKIMATSLIIAGLFLLFI